MRAPLGAVHAILDLGVVARRDLPDRVAALLDAGLPSLQLRGASADDEPLARALRTATRERGALFVVNANVALARAVDADGVHLRADGPAPATARPDLPPGMLVGASGHDERELARTAGADWVFVSPVFPTASKPGVPGLGLTRLAELCAIAPAPVYALGGVTAERVAACRDAGAAGVAAIRAAWGDPAVTLVRTAVAAFA